jgi:hypothetical protein
MIRSQQRTKNNSEMNKAMARAINRKGDIVLPRKLNGRIIHATKSLECLVIIRAM